MSVQEWANWIVLAGAAVMAIWNILKALGAVGDKSKEKLQNTIKEILKEELPKQCQEYIVKHTPDYDERVKDLTEPTVNKMYKNFSNRFDKLEDLILNQTEDIKLLQDQNSDFLRRELRKVYHKYRKYQKIPQYDFYDCQTMMENYTGNSYARLYWDKMCQWEIVEDDEFIE